MLQLVTLTLLSSNKNKMPVKEIRKMSYPYYHKNNLSQNYLMGNHNTRNSKMLTRYKVLAVTAYLFIDPRHFFQSMFSLKSAKFFS